VTPESNLEAELTVDNTKDVEALRHMAHEFEEGFNSGDVERFMRFYADRYVDVNLRNPLQTHAQRRDYYVHVRKTRNIHLRVQPDDIVVEGNLAFVRGTILISPAEAGSGAGKGAELRYLEIARKAADGSWKVWWGMDGPVQEYEPVGE
jgi:ketosteroid isomerase-like protein